MPFSSPPEVVSSTSTPLSPEDETSIMLLSSESNGMFSPAKSTLKLPNTGSVNGAPGRIASSVVEGLNISTVNFVVAPVPPVICARVPSMLSSSEPSVTACPLVNVSLLEPTRIVAVTVSRAVDSVTDFTATSIPLIFLEAPSVTSLLSPLIAIVAVVLVPVTNSTL